MGLDSTPIICDTNIWYKLSDGRIPVAFAGGKRLLFTHITGEEFCSTMNAMRDYDQLRKAVIAMWQFSLGNRPYHALEYIKLISGYTPNKRSWEQIKTLLGNVVKISKPNPDYENTSDIAFRDFNSSQRQDAQQFNDFVEDRRCEHRANLKLENMPMGQYIKRMKSPVKRQEHLEATENAISSWLPGIEINWSAIELFVRTLDKWIRQLETQYNLKMTVTDWNDVTNLVYVGPGDLYWTDDHIKTEVYIINSGCGHYLYTPN